MFSRAAHPPPLLERCRETDICSIFPPFHHTWGGGQSIILPYCTFTSFLCYSTLYSVLSYFVLLYSILYLPLIFPILPKQYIYIQTARVPRYIHKHRIYIYIQTAHCPDNIYTLLYSLSTSYLSYSTYSTLYLPLIFPILLIVRYYMFIIMERYYPNSVAVQLP